MQAFTDQTLMPFGGYRGTKLANVPASYLLWIYDNLTLTPPLKDYIERNKDVLQVQVKRDSKFNSR